MNPIMACYSRFDQHGPIPWDRLPKGPRRLLLFAFHRLEYAVFLAFGLALLAAVVLLMLTGWLSERTQYGLRIEDFGTALVGALLISVVSFVLSVAIPGARKRRRHRD